jgi:acetolactate synthase regulatory subunit
MDLSVLPFTVQLPAGYSFPATSPGTQEAAASGGGSSSPANAAAASASSQPVDVVNISTTWDAGSFTAVAGDTYRVGDLFKGSAPAGQSIAGYRVALGNGGGQMLLNNVDVSARTSFTADEFAHLTYTAGDNGTLQSIVVVAQTGTRLANGSLSQVIDSQAVWITASVTGVRSINAMNALTIAPAGADADIVAVVKEASILTGVGSGRPTLSTDGNFTAVAGDIYRLGDLFKGSAPAGQSIAGYRVAMAGGGGQMLLDNVDVSGRTTFTADEFAHLTYTAGEDGTQQNLVVVAQTGTPVANGNLSQVTDSQAMQITASVTGVRSINAMNALTTTPADADGNVVAIVKEANILTGVGSGRPALSTDGNFTAVAGDAYRLGDLFKGSAPTGQSIAGYRVALGAGGGQMLLNNVDVSSRTTFTADEFAHLTYMAGDDGTQQSLVVVAQTGTRLSNGNLTQVTDSQAVQIAAAVTGTRSINAMNALSTAAGADANVVAVVKEASILTGLGSGRPTLSTDGNFTAGAGDTYRVGDLFKASAPTGQSIAGYRVALGDGGGQMLLNNVDVSGRTTFTADEFAHLTYTAGDDGTRQSLVVVAQTGTRRADGSLSQVTDSQAVQITASVTGIRSINAMNALTTAAAGADADIVAVVKEANILTGVGSGQPTLNTDGNFTAVAGDTYRLGDLFKGSAPAGQTIGGYRVALGSGGGQLLLNNVDVSGRTTFTANEFAQLTYTAGEDGTQQSLVVVAQTGTRLANGSLSQVTDSQAIHISASVTGARSINAMNALITAPSGADANVAAVVKEAGVLSGFGSGRPSLQTPLTPDPAVALSALATAIGAYSSAGQDQAGAAADLSAYYPRATGNSVSAGTFTDPGSSLATALLLLAGTATGAFQSAGNLSRQSEAIKAYNFAKAL